MASIIGGQIYRYRRVSSPTERQQTKWIVFGTIVELVLGLVYIFPALLFPELRTPGSPYFLLVKPLIWLLALFGPLCFGIAILRYRLWEIDIIIHRTLVYVALSACVIGLYVLVVVGLGSLLQAQGNILLSLLATGLIALLFQPLRQRLQQAVNRLMYGERDDPYAVLSRLGSRLEAPLAHDPLANTLLSDLAQRTQATVAGIRRLVYALRPPALDELGLLSALRELALQSSDQVAMCLDAPDCLPPLSAAVEVAIYRIAQEALTNVVRHAHACHCDIRLALDEPAGWLSLSIQDDGCGLPPSRGMGVGLVSMRERAEELGGTWTLEKVPTGGTRVLAGLPYARSEKADMLVVVPSVVPQEEE